MSALATCRDDDAGPTSCSTLTDKYVHLLEWVLQCMGKLLKVVALSRCGSGLERRGRRRRLLTVRSYVLDYTFGMVYGISLCSADVVFGAARACETLTDLVGEYVAKDV